MAAHVRTSQIALSAKRRPLQPECSAPTPAASRLNVLHRENVDESEILATLDPLFARYATSAKTAKASAISWFAAAWCALHRIVRGDRT